VHDPVATKADVAGAEVVPEEAQDRAEDDLSGVRPPPGGVELCGLDRGVAVEQRDQLVQREVVPVQQ
jgi:hypothetical protein